MAWIVSAIFLFSLQCCFLCRFMLTMLFISVYNDIYVNKCIVYIYSSHGPLTWCYFVLFVVELTFHVLQCILSHTVPHALSFHFLLNYFKLHQVVLGWILSFYYTCFIYFKCIKIGRFKYTFPFNVIDFWGVNFLV
jgi:hypothetical protein